MRLIGSTLLTFLGASLALGALVPPSLAQEVPSAAGRSGQSQATLAPGSTILAELNSSVDSKKVKAGDLIVAHTVEALKSADDRTIVPKGTKIEGHITQATARGKGGQESALGIQFEKAVLKEGGEIELNVVIQALGAPISFAAPSDLGTQPTVGTTQTSPMGGHSGPPAGQSPQVATPPESSGISSPQLGAKSRGVIGLHGLTLNAEPANNRPASTVVSNGKSVRLDGGTQMLLVVQAQGAEPSGQ
jgi:hypothetical protein